jgi:DNA-binding transcriptional ArsR family regulator
MSRIAADTDVFYAIADPTRRRILDLLAKEDAPVKKLLPLFEISQPAISQHLKVLRDVGLVTERREGRQRIYSVAAAELEKVAGWAMQYERFWTKRLVRLGDYLDRKHGHDRQQGASRSGGQPQKPRKGK